MQFQPATIVIKEIIHQPHLIVIPVTIRISWQQLILITPHPVLRIPVRIATPPIPDGNLQPSATRNSLLHWGMLFQAVQIATREITRQLLPIAFHVTRQIIMQPQILTIKL